MEQRSTLNEKQNRLEFLYSLKKILSLLWKPLSVVLLLYTILAGFLMDVPRLNIINETIRALYFHVPMWFGMTFMFTVSTVYAIRYLRKSDRDLDIISFEFANAGLIFGLLGIATGMIWANYTWGSPWSGDPKQNGAAVACLIYLAYFVLRGSLDNAEQRGRLSAVLAELKPAGGKTDADAPASGRRAARKQARQQPAQ